MNLPNQLTTLRLLLIPVFLWAVYIPDARWVALAIFLVASITDFFDGYLARKWNMITDYGKVMDPLADKMLITGALVAFVEFKWIPAWTVVIILARDFLIQGLRTILAEQGEVMGAGMMGKIKTNVQMIAVVLLLAGATDAGWWVYLGAVAITVLSGIDYVWRSRKVLATLTGSPPLPPPQHQEP
ncbi:MAG: CDP-diacylglycerol--glycerol-3-phosphate 3-phosphatidyltransferase [Candidatus Sericytochromatia bacterium]|nr:CDP-diacylglycerol--glycerol-3-phosphate 3-phosphatidyltransferase [Candidatus Sericytochromatia bacterium]